MNHKLHRVYGFTLIEVLVAISLFMVLTIGLIGLTQLSVRSSRALKERSKAVVILNETMETTQAVRASNFSSLRAGQFHPEIVDGKWDLVEGTELIDGVERWVDITTVQREVACGGERVCPIVDSGGVVDPVTFRAKAKAKWQEQGEDKLQELESILTFWR